MTRYDIRAMVMYLLAIAIGYVMVAGFWKLWAIPQLQELTRTLEGSL